MHWFPTMIHVQNLTKYYGDYPALQNATFKVAAGQVVGFLGHNGAGKSTTMRILAGFLTASSGKATIDGLDVFDDTVEVRRRIGYMPESCPLYVEMRVEEYLHFRAGIKGVYGSKRKDRIEYVLERCWLTEVRRQIIGTLSKGYRQRVGLADALVANPPVLILDEPTAGLDPTQIRSTRKLIQDLGKQHTILLSTHILSEVEMACDSLIIIHRGRVALQSSLADLRSQTSSDSSLVVTLEGPGDVHLFQHLAGIDSFTALPQNHGRIQMRMTGTDLGRIAHEVTQSAQRHAMKVVEIRQERPTLEDLFVKITSREEEATRA